MPVSHVVYISRASAYVNRQELACITSASARNNARSDITGALVFCDGYFIQILEGEPAALAQTLERITDDPRHADVQVIQRREGVERMFGGWEMSCLHEQAMTPAQRARAEACIKLVQREDLVDRIGNDAHLLLLELRNAIAAESCTVLHRAA